MLRVYNRQCRAIAVEVNGDAEIFPLRCQGWIETYPKILYCRVLICNTIDNIKRMLVYDHSPMAWNRSCCIYNGCACHLVCNLSHAPVLRG